MCGDYMIFRDPFPSVSAEPTYYILPAAHSQGSFGRIELGHLSHYTIRGGKTVKNIYPKQGIPPAMKEAVDMAIALSVMDA